MAKLLKILFLINIIFLSYMNIIACSDESHNKRNLNNISTLQGLPSLAANNKKPYSSINHSWYEEAQIFKYKPLLLTFDITFYQDNTGDVEVGYNLEQVGIVYIKITADPNDPYWKGATPLIAINLELNLDTVKSLTGINPIRANSQQKYRNIDSTLYNQAEVFNHHPLVLGFTVHYFTDEKGTNLIDDQDQVAGDIYVMITAAENDHYWTGITDLLKVTLVSSGSQVNLDTVKVLEGMPEVDIISNQKNKDITKKIYNQSVIFKMQLLADGFTVHYFSDMEAINAVDENYQVAGDIYVTITAAKNDFNWMGTSHPLKLTLSDKRSDLNTINDLSGMDPIIVNPNLTYQEINKNAINSCNQLKTSPLTGNFTVHYFSDKFAKHAINNYYQQVGTVYVMIIPDYHTGTKWKANKVPIIFPIENNNNLY